MRAFSLAILVCLPAFASVPVGTAAYDDIIVAVLDSGIRPSHAAFAPGQVVAWYDFVRGLPTPYDDVGHGTEVASMVGGRPFSSMTNSHAPGVKLAIGKVLSPTGAWWSDVTDGIYWAVDGAGADIISISIYNYGIEGGPFVAYGQDVYAAMEYARARGVLVVLLAGNGYSNAGIPSMSYFHTPVATDDALIVGGATNEGLTPTAPLGDMEPEVVAPYTVTAACPAFDTCLARVSGTSFATPLVAGAAARLLGAARGMGSALTPADLESMLKATARDTAAPPTLEGYGFIGAPEVATSEQKILAGQPLGGPTTLVNALYVENVQATARQTWRQGL